MAAANAPPHVVFRVDAGPTIGGGHLARCAALADALIQRGAAVTMVMSEASREAAPTWITSPATTIEWIDASAALDPDAIMRRREHADVVVVDGYQFPSIYLSALRGSGARTVYIDDLGETTLDCDLAVNVNFHAERHPSKVVAGGRVLAGPRYQLLRQEFRVARKEKRDVGRPRHVLVTMGAADPDNETSRVIRGLEGARQEGLTVEVVVGPASRHAEAVNDVVSACRHHHVRVARNVTNMAQRMLWADIAITATGGTCAELACVGVPSIGIAIASNQEPVAEAAGDLGVVLSLGPSRSVTESRIANAVDALLEDAALRTRMAERQRAVVDGEGADRVAAEIVELSRKPARSME